MQENYVDFFTNIEDFAKASEGFQLADEFERVNFWKERNEDLRVENEYFITFLSGLNVMLNNLNVRKFDRLKTMSGPKVLKLREAREKAKRRTLEKCRGVLHTWKFRDILEHGSALALILQTSREPLLGRTQPYHREAVEEDAYIADSIDEYLKNLEGY